MAEAGGAAAATGPEFDRRSGLSYVQILRSTAMIGGSSLVNIAFSAVRMKAIAMLLGPGGVGIMSLYSSMADLTQTLAGLGIQASGVRQIAEAAGAGDDGRVHRVAAVLRRISLGLGLGGALLLAALAVPLSVFTFGSRDHVGGIVLLSAVVFLGLVASAQLALLQGLRRIADLARISMISAMASTVAGVGSIYLLGEDGIVPALVSVGAIAVVTSWWFSSRIVSVPQSLSAREVGREAGELLKLGVVFMASGFLTVGASYVIRLIVLKMQGVEAAGLYQAAWALGGLYAGFILQAMGTDFYPRLTAAAHDHVLCNRLVNEQAHVSILLAGPGLLATMTLAPLLMTVFYSHEFHPAADLLRWLCLGMMLRIIAWPMGFIVLAKGARMIFFWTEIAATWSMSASPGCSSRRSGSAGRRRLRRSLSLAHRAHLRDRAPTERLSMDVRQSASGGCVPADGGARFRLVPHGAGMARTVDRHRRDRCQRSLFAGSAAASSPRPRFLTGVHHAIDGGLTAA